MQTARRVQECTQQFPDRDMVLERLIAEGMFDRVDPNTPDVHEELAMNHSSAMAQRLLMHVENLESQVCPWEQPMNFFVKLMELISCGMRGVLR